MKAGGSENSGDTVVVEGGGRKELSRVLTAFVLPLIILFPLMFTGVLASSILQKG